VNKLKYAALAAFIGAVATPAMADKAETKGGLVVKTDDGRFEMKIGGRIHFDTYVALDDEDIAGTTTGTTAFRRARLTMEGKAYGWMYKFENDFTGKAEGGGFREMWLGTKLWEQTIRIGQAKPYRGMEELTSSNEIVFMERPFATASGIYSGNQFAQGLFLDGNANNWTWGVAGYSLRNEDAPAQEGAGAAARVTFAPIATDASVLHLGLTASTDRPHGVTGTPAAPITRSAAGRPFGRIAGATTIATTAEDRTAYGLELAGKAGPFYAQGEWATIDYKGTTTDESVDTYYVQASYLLTGETKPYDVKKGVFKSPKPNGTAGAWELKARYDVMEGETGTADELSQWIVGANWYVNPNVRFMLEYVDGEIDNTTGTDPNVKVIQLRSQMNF